MEENKVLTALENNPLTTAICEGADTVGNLFDMEEALLLASAFLKDHKTRLIVKKNRYEAQQLYNRLAPLLEEDQTLLYTMEESLRVQAIASSPQDRQELIEALIKMREDKPRLIVANLASYMRFLPDRALFDSMDVELKAGQEMEMGELKNRLVRAGYTRENYVDRPGTFASRGGIIDIFSLGHEHPVRVEFFDTEIDSIRFFDEATQRTIKEENDVHIYPATDLLFTDDQIKLIEENTTKQLDKILPTLQQDDAEILEDAVKNDMRDLKSWNAEPSLYKYYSYFESASVLDYTNAHVILSTSEEAASASKQLVTDNVSFMQEQVQDYRSLPRYIMFHDLDSLNQKRAVQKFHDFVSFEHPIVSGIAPQDPHPSNYLAWLPEEAQKENTYLALEKEDRDLLSDKMDTSGFRFIAPVFYEGFKYDDYSILTRKDIFHHVNRRTPYVKTFKEGQVLQNVLELQQGDYVVHSEYGIGQYLGISTREQNGKKADYLHIAYRDGDDLFVPLAQFQLVRKYTTKEGAGVKLSKLGSGQWEKTKAKVSARVEEIAGRLVDLYADRSENIGYAYPPDGPLEREFDESFEFESTPDQLQATAEIKHEMEKAKPMDHLLCGDVGFGKTEVAMRAAYKAVVAGKQVAFLAPTTILSMQHYKTLKARFADFGVNIAMVNRFVPDKEITQIKKDLKAGLIDIIVGTHKLFNKTFQYKDLGLLIIDEEQRFGVEHKEKIKEMKHSVDVLSLSATPIPRTLQMSLIGVRSISTLNTPPAHRHPVQTYIMEKKGTVIEEIIQRELARSGQVFYLHNRVQDIYQVAKQIQSKFPDAEVGVAHGKMSRDEIENVMMDFAENRYQILVTTTIIETGLDIANANTIIIENADRFGLAQLYQIRGRVGRRERLAYCYLMVDPQKQLSEQAHKRLKSIKEFTQLGSGYRIAMRDLTIRGAGDMLGPQQAGFIDQIGLDLYLDLLSDAIARKKGEEPKEKEEPEKTALIRVEGYIPAPFTENDGDKLALYQDIKSKKTFEDLDAYEERTRDLFGRIPREVEQIFAQRRLDLFANEPGVDTLKETDRVITIAMTPQWSSEADGVKLFETLSAISRQIKLSYRNSEIQIMFEKKRHYLDTLAQIIKILRDPAYKRRKRAR